MVVAAYASVVEDEDVLFIGFAQGEDAGLKKTKKPIVKKKNVVSPFAEAEKA